MNGDWERSEELPSWVPKGVDVAAPNVARMYDYALGGFHNFVADRESVEQIERAMPGLRQGAYVNRAFLSRVVRWLVGVGIRQFLDIGSGIPTVGNVHEIAGQVNPDVRVMYVDIDPVAVAHARAVLAGNPRARVLKADLRRPLDIVDHPYVTDLLDFSEPVAVTLVSVLHFISDADDPFAILAQLRDAIVAGSYIVLSHATHVTEEAEAFEAVRRISQRTPTPFYVRPWKQVEQLLTGLDIVEPGVVTVTDWRPDPSQGKGEPWPGHLVAVGRKP